MAKLIDVNPFRRGNYRMEEPEEISNRESLTQRLKKWFLRYVPKSWQGWLVGLLILVILWKLLVFVGVLPSTTFPSVAKNKWQAVFLINSQVYFGHLQEVDRNYAVIKNVYYLRTPEQVRGSNQQQQINLVKLGNEIHGPEDEVYVPKAQIIFWQNLKDNSPVVQAIKNQLGGQ